MEPAADLRTDLGKGWCVYEYVHAHRAGMELVTPKWPAEPPLHCLEQGFHPASQTLYDLHENPSYRYCSALMTNQCCWFLHQITESPSICGASLELSEVWWDPGKWQKWKPKEGLIWWRLILEEERETYASNDRRKDLISPKKIP